jgi:ABC-type dipeptide/oligopeptide/nickel transport system permease subunit
MSEERIPSRTLLHAEAQLGLGADAGLPAADAERLEVTRVGSPTRDALRRFRRNWAAIISLVIVLFFVLIALLAPFVHTSNPQAQDFNSIYAGPSNQHWFGTDSTGRDLYSRLMYGLRVPLVVGFVGTLLTVILGSLIGVVSGYFGGRVDALLSRFTDLIFAFPAFVLAVVVVSLFGPGFDSYLAGSGRILLLTIVFAVVSWPPLMRFVRSLALTMKEQQFIEAARTVGSTNWSIMFRHLLPNMWGLILVQAAFIIIGVISTETVLSILGLGVAPPNPDLGQMLYDGSQAMSFGPWGVLFPSIAIALLILAFTFLADGLRDAVDPRGRR